MQFILGTANLLSNYGIDKITKGVGKIETLKIFKDAQSHGIFRIDTAESYPGIENFLGSNNVGLNLFKVDSKIKLLDGFTEEILMDHVYASISKLGIKKLNTLYLHNLNPLFDSNLETTKKCFTRITEEGLAENIGVSVYSEEEIKFCMDRYPNFKSFQILENICDRRFFNSIYLSKLAESGIELNVRSIFLQGLLLADLALIPPHLDDARNSLIEFHEYALSINSSRFELCVAYAKKILWASNIVIGVGSLAELIAITRERTVLPNNYFEKIPELPARLKDPRNWTI